MVKARIQEKFAVAPCDNSLFGRGVVLIRTSECLGQYALSVVRSGLPDQAWEGLF